MKGPNATKSPCGALATRDANWIPKTAMFAQILQSELARAIFAEQAAIPDVPPYHLHGPYALSAA